MNIVGFLMGMAGPLVKKVMAALGIGVISYAAVVTAFQAAQSSLLSSYGSISYDVVWMAERAGLNTAMGIILGAMAAKLSLTAFSRFGKLAA